MSGCSGEVEPVAENEWSFLGRQLRKVFVGSRWFWAVTYVFRKVSGASATGDIGTHVGAWMGCCPLVQHFMEHFKSHQVESRIIQKGMTCKHLWGNPSMTLGYRTGNFWQFLHFNISESKVNFREDVSGIKISCWVKQMGLSILHWHQERVKIYIFYFILIIYINIFIYINDRYLTSLDNFS